MRLLAAQIGEEADVLVGRIVRADDAAILAELETARGLPPGALAADYRRSLAEARARLIDEVGDPSPYRLA
jgi:hypothetical protein